MVDRECFEFDEKLWGKNNFKYSTKHPDKECMICAQARKELWVNQDAHSPVSPEGSYMGHEFGGKTVGLRFNSGKNQLELIPAEWIWALGSVLTAGAKKYAPRNWEKGMKKSILVGCIMRHLMKRICGEIYDSETECTHMAHVAWNALALMSYDIRGIGEDDLIGNMEWLKATKQAASPDH